MPDWRGYLSESRKFLEVAQAIDLPGYGKQAASNAVHAAIAATDALGVWRTGRSAGDHSHAEVLSLLDQACTGTPLESALLDRMDQLGGVLRHGRSARPDEAIDCDSSREVVTEATDYIAWIERALSVDTA